MDSDLNPVGFQGGKHRSFESRYFYFRFCVLWIVMQARFFFRGSICNASYGRDAHKHVKLFKIAQGLENF
jgi:hypothetical protein